MILFTNLMLVFFSQRIILDWINKHNKYKQIFKDFSQLVSHFVYEIYWFVSILFSDYGVERVINLHSRMSVTNINSFLFAWNALVFVTSLIPPIVCVCVCLHKWPLKNDIEPSQLTRKENQSLIVINQTMNMVLTIK